MGRPIAVCLLAGVLFGASVATLRAEITAEQVRQAIDRGVAYLKSQQQQTDPPWPNYFRQPGGVTGLCTLALLHCGVEPRRQSASRR